MEFRLHTLKHILLCGMLLGAAPAVIADNAAVTEKIYEVTDRMPEFPGGEKALLEFVAKNVVYPQACADKNIQGRVVVKFVVNADGSTGEAQVLRSPDEELSAEALRVVKTLPRFEPGTVDGRQVPVWFTLPVNFRLKEPESDKGLEKIMAIYAERQLKEYDKFVELGEEAEVNHNKNHAIAYYKEAFSIMPKRPDMINRCEKLIGDDKAALADLYNWAYPAIWDATKLDYEEPVAWQLTADVYERLGRVEPLDSKKLAILAVACYNIGDEARTNAATRKIYALKDRADIPTLCAALYFDGDFMMRRKDYKGVVKLIQPRVKHLVGQEAESSPLSVMFMLAKAQASLGKRSDAAATLVKSRDVWPEKFAAEMDAFAANPAEKSNYDLFISLLNQSPA